MANLEDLFKFKKAVELKDPNKKSVWKGWIRILGDIDNDEAARQARLRSSDMRKKLRDPESAEYLEAVEQIENTARDAIEDLVVAAQNSKFIGEAFTTVEREDVTKMEEVAVLPDAPTLEEQEKYDLEEREKQERYQKAIDDFIEERKAVLKAEVKQLPEEDLFKRAREALSLILPTSTYMRTLIEYKVYLGTFKDEACKHREFSSIDAYRNSAGVVKEFLEAELNALELSPDEIKN